MIKPEKTGITAKVAKLMKMICVLVLTLTALNLEALTLRCQDIDFKSPSNPFTFPEHIDKVFQQEMQALGVSAATIKRLNKQGLGEYEPDFNSIYNLFNELNGSFNRLEIYKIYKAALNAINKTSATSLQSGKNKISSIWDVFAAIEFHEVLHQANHGYQWLLEPFKKLLGSLNVDSFEVLSASMTDSYTHLNDSFNHFLHSTDSAEYREFIIEELLVTLIWEETLFHNGDRVIDNLNAKLKAKGAPLLPREKLLELVAGELLAYQTERDLVLDTPRVLATESQRYGIKMTETIHDSVERIIKPVADKMLNIDDIESIEMGSIFRQFGYQKANPNLISEQRLMRPILNDNQEIRTRIEAQKDMNMARNKGTGVTLSVLMRDWLENSVSHSTALGWGQKSLLFFGDAPADIPYWKRYLKLDSDEILTQEDLKALVYTDVSGIFHDMVKLYQLLSNTGKIKSDRIKALQWLCQSVVDPTHEYGLQKYYVALTKGSPQVQEQALRELITEKSNELDHLNRIYQEVDFLLKLESLGDSIKGISYATILEKNPSEAPKLLIDTGHNPTLALSNNVSNSIPNSLVPTKITGENMALGGNTGKTGVLVYGENENGKSTYLRTVAQLIHLALIGARLPVQHMELTPMAVYTALNSKDSLASGQSHHAADIESINKVVKLVQENPYALVLIDELATGTIQEAGNATEAAYLDWFINNGALTILSTHRLGTYDLSQVSDQLLVLTASNYSLNAGEPDREKLIEGGIKTLERHGTPMDIIARANQIIKQQRR